MKGRKAGEKGREGMLMRNKSVMYGPENATGSLIGGGQNYGYAFNIPGNVLPQGIAVTGIAGQVNVAQGTAQKKSVKTSN